MNATKNILLLPGDGIGPEIVAEARRVLEAVSVRRGGVFRFTEDVIGGAALDRCGEPFPEATRQAALAADAVLFGAVGDPRWASVPFHLRPEVGILGLRKDLGLFANVRPAVVFDSLVQASTLKPEVIRGLDLVIVRELTGGVYFGEPRGIEDLGAGERRGVNTHVYTSSEIRRIARVAFDVARTRRKKVCSCDKANVMEAGLLWREEVTALAKAEYPDIELTHLYADVASMRLVQNPKMFDVILTDNLFGDMLSDQAATLTGSLGLLPSASLGVSDAKGFRRAVYEPIHGSAPDIAGKGIANPLATILSVAMMLRFSFGWNEDADRIDTAVRVVLDSGVRTPDIATPGQPTVNTKGMGDAVLEALERPPEGRS